MRVEEEAICAEAARNVAHQARTGIDLEPGANTSEMILAKRTIAGLIAMASFCGVVLPPEKVDALVKLWEPLCAVLGIALPAIFGMRISRKNAVDRANAAIATAPPVA